MRLKYPTILTVCLLTAMTACSDANFSSGSKSKNTQPEFEAQAEPKTTVDSGEIISDDSTLKLQPKFGMLITNLKCAFCHIKVIGDMASIGDIESIRGDSVVDIMGKWFLGGNFSAIKADAHGTPRVNVSNGIVENYKGVKVPKDVNGDGQADFPEIDWSKIGRLVTGKIFDDSNGAKVEKKTTTHQLLVGTPSKPIKIKGDIFIDGDLVITGDFMGVGTIYVSGNIYIPFDLKAKRSAFPFPDDPDDALAKAKELVSAKSTDALALATKENIYLGRLNAGIYEAKHLPAATFATLNKDSVYSWLPNFNTYLGNAQHCQTGAATQAGSFNLIDAFLYAKRFIGGVTKRASYSIRGGIISDDFHVLNALNHPDGSYTCPATTSLIHGRPLNKSYVEYDYRYQTGRLRVLEHLKGLR